MTSVKQYVKQLHTVYENALHEDDSVVDLPEAGSIRLPLHKHQKAALYRMASLERDSLSGRDISGETVFANYGILGDTVGAGKSLMILSHISRLSAATAATEAPIANPTHALSVHPYSTGPFFSLKKTYFTDLSEANALIVVPHTLFRQWADYIKKQTTLKAYAVGRSTEVYGDSFLGKIQAAEVVLVSNTLMKDFVYRCREASIRWGRVFIDEADTIHLPGMTASTLPPARFYWFVTASWVNMIFPNNTMYLDKTYIHTHILSNSAYAHAHAHFRSLLNSQTTYYAYVNHSVKSRGLFHEVVSTSHPLRAYQVVKSSDEFVQSSIRLPPLHKRIVWCKTPITHRMVQGAIGNQVQQMLHAGDVATALEHLGVKGQTTKDLISAVTHTLQKDLENLRKTYTYKAGLDYSTAKAKEEALTALTEKIKQKEASIQSLKERIEGLGSDMCPICYDDPNEPLITPCCSHVFCATCLLMSLARNPDCPLCRGKVAPAACTKLLPSDAAVTNQIVEEGQSVAAGGEPPLEKKPDALLRILRENPQDRFLVFSRYDNPFDTLEATMSSMGIVVKQLKGNKDAIASTLKSFEAGTIRCLLLNSRFAGSGLNITSATHVILLHAMTHEEEKQILGRAYRMGRTESLQFVKLLHKDEESYQELEGTAEASA